MSDLNQVVALKFNTQALTASLRHAFAHELSAVLELVQNGRRAGADTVWISTAADGDQPCLTVSDNGSGIDDFQVLLEVATSGWDDSIARDERPYGLGFLASLYAAQAVQVVSRGRMLRMDTEAALSAQSFTVESCNLELPTGVATSVRLLGFDPGKLLYGCHALFQGYPIRVIVDGTELARPHAIDSGRFVSTEVGQLRTASIDSVAAHGRPHTPVVYLQGFCVQEPAYALSIEHQDVVHLDSSKWFGKFPDRNTVVNADEMKQAVAGVIEVRYRQALLSARRNLPREEFVVKYYKLAASLQMLHVFNDINIIPSAWVSAFRAMPYGCRSELEFLGDYGGKPFITRSEVESGAIVMGKLDLHMDPGCGEESSARRWVHAYARGALLLDTELDPGHWVYANMTITDDTEVHYRVMGVVKSGKADSRRLNRLWSDPNIVICRSIDTVDQNGVVATLREPVADEEENVIYVPLSEGDADEAGSPGASSSRQPPQYVPGTVLRLMADYFDEDDLNTDDVDFDEAAVNEMVREVLADSPEERLALALSAAIASYSSVRNVVCRIEVDACGSVRVAELRKLA